MKRLPLVLLFLFVPTLFGDEPKRGELLKSPRLVEGARRPRYPSMTAEELRAGVRVVSWRNHAVFGFNDPSVELYLPKSDSSIYAEVEFSKPDLVDKKRKSVKYEFEQGIYDFDDYSTEIRLTKEGGGLVDFARAVGMIKVRYPTRIKTIVVRKEKKSKVGRVTIDGPFVTYLENEIAIPVAATFSKIRPLRAYDKKGNELEQHEMSQTDINGEEVTRRIAFWGEVTEVQIDMVEEWSELAISYDLPPAAKLSSILAGTATPPPEGDTAGGKVTKTLVVSAPSAQEEAGEEDDSGKPSLSDDALEKLREAGYSSVNEENFVMSAVGDPVETVRLFLEAGLPVNSRNREEITPLHRAAFFGNLDVAKMLLEAGADPNVVDTNNTSALTAISSRCEAVPVVKLMLKRGANVNTKARGGATALMMAELSGCSEIAQLLRKAGGKR